MSYLTDYYSRGFTSPFGDCRPVGSNPCGRRHRGQDLSHSAKSGTQAVPALHAGRVVGHYRPNDGTGFGHGIIIRSRLADGNEYDISYSHGPWASSQRVGEWVVQGQIILHEGMSGFTSGPCVHIEQRRVSSGGFIDPRPEINRVARGAKTPGTGAPASTPPANPKPAQNDTPPAGEYNPFGIKWSKGFQLIAKHYGTPRYRGAIDAKWDIPNGGSIASFTGWLRANWGYVGNNVPGVQWRMAVQRWLKAKWGYGGKIDGVFGPQSKAALYRAENANWLALK